MLTVDHVRVRRSGNELKPIGLDRAARTEAIEIASAYIEAARAHEGRRREELDAVWDGIGHSSKNARVAAGLRKLVEDACLFEAEETLAPIDARRALFTRAAAARRTRGPEESFDRSAIVGDVAKELGVDAETLERALFADLRKEHVLLRAPTENGETITHAYELGQAQAILLRAVRVTCNIRAASPGVLRSFFGRLKFHQLLFSAERTEDGFRVVVDGPFSMFDAVTRYGLKLALLLPALRALDDWSLVAEVRWGKTRDPLVFRLSSAEFTDGAVPPLHLSDDVAAVIEGLRTAAPSWRVEPATTLLDLPGVGVCVPDIVLSRDGTPSVYVEVLGFWSRDAVFRRVELVEKGLGERIVFAASSRLRVSAEVLDKSENAALYVYRGKISPRLLLKHIEGVAATPST